MISLFLQHETSASGMIYDIQYVREDDLVDLWDRYLVLGREYQHDNIDGGRL